MHVLVIDDNLMWSVRLQKSLAALGHACTVLAKLPETLPNADIAILNLGNLKLSSDDLIAQLIAQKTVTVGHAGHKEREVLDAGLQRGCQFLVTNSQLTHKLEEVLRLPEKLPDFSR